MLFLSLALFTTAALGADLEPRGTSPLACSGSKPGLQPNTKTVSTLVSSYAQLIGNYTDALGQSFVSDSGFTDTSGSINALAGLPLDAVTFSSKAAFMANQETQPKIPLVVTSVNAVTCDTVVIRWTQTFGAKSLPAAGISILTFVCEGGEWKLKTVYTEFNSLVYFQDIGGNCTRA